MSIVKKRYIVPIIGAVATLGIAYMRKNSEGHEETTFGDTLKNAGKPDEVESNETDQLENAKMVSEGSQFGVQYYNHVKDDEMNYEQ